MYTDIHSPQFVTQSATHIEYLLPTIFAWSRGSQKERKGEGKGGGNYGSLAF
jgi:hypothetical protein